MTVKNREKIGFVSDPLHEQQILKRQHCFYAEFETLVSSTQSQSFPYPIFFFFFINMALSQEIMKMSEDCYEKEC